MYNKYLIFILLGKIILVKGKSFNICIKFRLKGDNINIKDKIENSINIIKEAIEKYKAIYDKLFTAVGNELGASLGTPFAAVPLKNTKSVINELVRQSDLGPNSAVAKQSCN